MERALLTLMLTAVSFTAVGQAPARAGEFKENWQAFWQRFHKDHRRNQCWPEPFIAADRASAREPWEVMKHNGWRLENTLSHQLFTEENQLTPAGVQKLRHICFETPMQRRMVYIQQAPSFESTQLRVAAVQESLATMLTPQGPPPIYVTPRGPRGGSGKMLDQIDQKMQEALPAPVLPSRESTTTGGL